MTTQTIVILFPAVAGLVLMIGTLFLIREGHITLNAVKETIEDATKKAKDNNAAQPAVSLPEALVAEIGKLKIRTHYPAIALFVVAFLCFAIALYYVGDPKMKVSGTLDGPHAKDYTVVYKGYVGDVFPDISGHFEHDVPSDVDLVMLEIGKAGLNPQTFPVYPKTVKKWPILCHLEAATPVPKPTVDPSQISQ
jgi:hypothetical protein